MDTLPPSPPWPLQDAKARFSELVREARTRGPQTVTLHGRDAVVVLAAEDYARLRAARSYPTLFEVMQACPAGDLPLGAPRDEVVVRDVEL